jgi:hypothetical protein
VGNAQGLIEALRVHLAELLIDNGELRDATVHLGLALGQQPANTRVQQLMRRALELPTPLTPPHDSFDWGSFDWGSAESELAGVVGSEFVDVESRFSLPPLLLASGIAVFFDQQRDKS